MTQQFNYPTTILFGSGAVDELGTRLKAAGGCFLLVTDPGLVQVGLADAVARRLTGRGVELEQFDSVRGNPVEADVVAGAARFRELGAVGLIALGGGSAMDAAKAIAVLVDHEGPLERFDDARGGDQHIQAAQLPPVYAIPTTAGTGSEVGRSGVIITEPRQVKTVIFHPGLMPRIAVLEPELTLGLPPSITAATGMDAFSHGLEAYLSRGFHPMADAVALGCLELVVANLPRAVRNGRDLEARGNMQIAASMGATAFQKGLGAIHSLAHPLSTRYGVHHGLANALLMPRILAWQLSSCADRMSPQLRDRYRRVAALLPGGAGAEATQLPTLLAEFTRSVGIEQSLAEVGLRAADLDALADEAFADPCHGSNPIPLTRDDLLAAYRWCEPGQ